MTALELLSAATHLVYLAIFVRVLVRAARQPTAAHVDVALFFAASATFIVQARIAQLLGAPAPPLVTAVATAFVVALPYLLLRLVRDFASVPTPIMRAAEAGFAVAAAAVLLVRPLVPPATLVVIVYFAAVAAYAAIAFLRLALRTHGVTKRRMQSIGVGTAFLVLAVALSGIGLFLPVERRGITMGLQQLCSLGSAVAYFLGFAPPQILRRAWQEPELRQFLVRAAELPRLPTTRDIVRELERAAAAATGGSASIGLYGAANDRLVYYDAPLGEVVTTAPGEYLAGRAFTEQRTVFSADPQRDDPAHAAEYRASRAGTVIAAPITAADRTLGVLAVYAERPPVFAQSDSELVALLADQAAVILESRALIDEAARVRAHEEATRLKEDFLSAAAHDLKTPLTTLVAQAQFLERKAARDPSAPMDAAGLGRIVREAKRLNSLVVELLDATRLEQGRLLGDREPVDLVGLAREVCERQPEVERCHVEADAPVVGHYDGDRIAQVLQNLIENALKYSPPDSPVTVRVWHEGAEARISVTDVGMGIPPDDLPHVFDRFRRGANVDARRFAGMGLGLYIVRGIVEQHGGRVWLESALGAGTTFHVALPLAPGAVT